MQEAATYENGRTDSMKWSASIISRYSLRPLPILLAMGFFAFACGTVVAQEIIQLRNGADVGREINGYLSRANSGSSFLLPRGKSTVLTQIDFDLLPEHAAVKIVGHGNNADGTGRGGTILDASELKGSVIVGAKRQNKYNIDLSDFTIIGNPSGRYHGIDIGHDDGKTIFAPAHCNIENITVKNVSGWGFRIEHAYNSFINRLYANKCKSGGIFLGTMNASNCGILTVRDCGGDYSIDIYRGSGWSIGTLYIESNDRAALRMFGEVRSLNIGTIYLEGNHRIVDGAGSEIRLGDSALSTEPLINVKINTIRMAAPFKGNEYKDAVIKFDRGQGVLIGFEATRQVQNETALFKFVSPKYETGVTFMGCVVKDSQFRIDLTNVNRKYTTAFVGCILTESTVIDPHKNAQFVGCSKL